jgi:hypothetical protein
MLRPLSTAAAVLAAAAAFAAPAASALTLPDGRGWEMVSPIEKNGGQVQPPGTIFGGGVLQAAADGGSVTYSSKASFAAPQTASSASQYISRRSATGWSTENVTTPADAGAFGDAPDGVPYQLFSETLDRGLIAAPRRCAAAPCERAFDLRSSVGGGLTPSVEEPDLHFVGSTPDLGQVVLSTCAALTPEATQVPPAPAPCDPAESNLYVWTAAGLRLVNLLPGETQGTPGAALASQAGAISAAGGRIYFEDAGNLYLREGGHTAQVDGAPAVGGGGTFQTTAGDGAVAFFTKAGHLYRYDAIGATTTDLTPGGEVLGVLGASADGSYLYFVTAAGLELAHGGAVTTVAAAADASNYPPTGPSPSSPRRRSKPASTTTATRRSTSTRPRARRSPAPPAIRAASCRSAPPTSPARSPTAAARRPPTSTSRAPSRRPATGCSSTAPMRWSPKTPTRCPTSTSGMPTASAAARGSSAASP